MVKIPTFTSQQNLTDQSGSVTTNIQVSPTATTAAAILPAAEQVTTFAIKKRDLSEKLEANKISSSIKGEIDILIKKNEKNANEEDVLNKLSTDFDNLKKTKLSNIKNRRIRERVNNQLALEYPEYVNTIKSNSFTALKSQSLETVNNKLNDITAKYSTTTNPKLKEKYKQEGEALLEGFKNDFELDDFTFNKKKKAFSASLITGDILSLAGTEGSVEKIKQLDAINGGEKTLSNAEFAAGIVTGYENKITELTIVGDPNADFDKAQALIDEARNIERENGFKVDFGASAKKLDDLEEKIIAQKITHESRIDLINQGKELNEYITSQKSILRKSFTNDFGTLGADDSPEKAVEAQKEYDIRMDKYLKLNPDASIEEKIDYAGDLTNLLKDKYQDIDIEKFSTFNLERNKFELVSETKQITNSVKIYQEYASNPRGFIEKSDNPEAAMEIIKGIESKAKLNGYVDEKGNGDVFAFYNRFIEIVENRNPE
jgi:hypothetical protein